MSDNRITIPIGPQHPSLEEPGSFDITLEGEKVINAVIGVGYNHRGLEKTCENRSYTQALYIIERVCGICSHAHGSLFCMGVEELAGVSIPARAEYIRVVVAELERLHSHLLWLGIACHEIGFDTVFMYAWRDREKVLDLLATLGGNRVNYGINTLGGVRRDITPDDKADILKTVAELEEELKHYLDLALTESTLISRLKGVGKLTAEEVRSFGAVGPVARAAGVVNDVRVVEPYGAYKEIKVKAVTDNNADVYGRTAVRIFEMVESLNTIRVCLDNIPDTPLTVKMPRRIPAGEVIVRVEAPRGEDVHFIRSNGTEIPERVRVRAPTEANWHGMKHMLEGGYLADVPITIAAIDPCYSCTDRAITLFSKENTRVTDWAALRQYGIDWYKSRGADLTTLKF